MDINILSDLVAPDMIERQRGGWLVVSGRGAIIRLATTGATAAEARERFDRLFAQWASALDLEPAAQHAHD